MGMIASTRGHPRSESAADSQPGRILALDYGRRRIGLAISDEMGMAAQPLETFERKNRAADLRRLREIVRAHRVSRIIVGHPVRLDGSAGEMAAETKRFAARLGKELGLPVELVDERLSSWEAGQLLTESRGIRLDDTRTERGKHRAPVDHIAAAVILRDYLASRERASRRQG